MKYRMDLRNPKHEQIAVRRLSRELVSYAVEREGDEVFILTEDQVPDRIGPVTLVPVEE